MIEDGLHATFDPSQSSGSYPYTAGLRFHVDARAQRGARASQLQVFDPASPRAATAHCCCTNCLRRTTAPLDARWPQAGQQEFSDRHSCLSIKPALVLNQKGGHLCPPYLLMGMGVAPGLTAQGSVMPCHKPGQAPVGLMLAGLPMHDAAQAALGQQ